MYIWAKRIAKATSFAISSKGCIFGVITRMASKKAYLSDQFYLISSKTNFWNLTKIFKMMMI